MNLRLMDGKRSENRRFLFFAFLIFVVATITIADLNVNDQNLTYVSLSDTTVYMTGTSELHLTGDVLPLSNCTIHLNSTNAWLFLENIKPSVVSVSYLNQMKVNGAAAVMDANVRVVQYSMGTVVIPHSSNYPALEVFTGTHFSGDSRSNFTLHTYYRSNDLDCFNDAISSFRLKRGYMATFAQNSDGTGVSKVYIAGAADVNIEVMPPALEKTISFVRVFPWRWVNKKGWAGGEAEESDALNCSWRYDWNNVASSTLDTEYIPMRHNRYWNNYEHINTKLNSTAVLAFNEPDSPGEASMSVSDVLAQWPSLLASGLRLGSPATTDGGLSWLYDFIDQADAMNYRVDFVAVHWYQGCQTATSMYNWLLNVHRRTGRPIWVTEWNNGATWTSCEPTYDSQATAIQQMITMMNNAPFIERYSIFQWVGDTRKMFYADGLLTPAGIIYRDSVVPEAVSLDTNHEADSHVQPDETGGITTADLSKPANSDTVVKELSVDGNSGSPPREPELLVPGTVIHHMPASSGVYLGSPGIVSLAKGVYLAKHDEFGPGTSEWRSPVTRVYRSDDSGLSWKPISTVEGLFWSSIFVHNEKVYLLGTAKHHGDTVILRSSDNGKTWTRPVDESAGLLLKGQYHTAPVPVLIHNGRIWRAMEDAMGGTRWGHRYRAFMMSAPLDADLLRHDSWTCSNVLAGDPNWLNGQFGGWLEGNAVVTPEGQIVNILRVDVPKEEKAAMVNISADGKVATFKPEKNFIDFPGGAKKFTIRYDSVSKQYWSLSNYIPPAYQSKGNAGGIRNTLALVSSADLRHWQVKSILLSHPDTKKHGFQYVDWLFEDKDIIAVSRTAYDDNMGGAHNYHDANYLTFHRFVDFRSMDDGIGKNEGNGFTEWKVAEKGAK